MNAETLISILEDNTPLREDVDLFYLEMPLDKSGLWFEDSPIDNNRTGTVEYDIYYRGKDKQKAMLNIYALTDLIEDIDKCRLDDGTEYKLKVLFTWDYIEKDSEGYYVFNNRLRLI